MKCFHELNCDNMMAIQQQAITYLTKKYDLSDQKSLKTNLWLKINTVDFLKENALLMSWTNSLNLKIKEVALTVVNQCKDVPLHVDELPVTAKINFPLLNYSQSANEWWSVPDHILKSIKPIVNQFGAEFHDLSSVDLSLCERIGSVRLTRPIVFNSQIPHKVVIEPSCEFPRVILTCMFWKEPIAYLTTH